MNIQKMIFNFVKWFLIGQGIIWTFLTLYIVTVNISVKEEGIGFTWIISILFGVVMTFVSVNKDSNNSGNNYPRGY